MSKLVIDLTGQKYGKLTIIGRNPENDKFGRTRWTCICDCGKTTIVASNNLRTGHTQSCGCLSIEATKKSVTKHGMTKSPEHYTWAAMKRRCYGTYSKDYADYGGRGITVCEEWLNSFESFYRDMGPRPSPKHSIDRIDVNGNYEPGNCRWASSEDQANNKRNSVYYEFEGEKLTVFQIARRVGITKATLYLRLKTMSVDDAVLLPVRGYKIFVRNGESKNLKEWCRALGIPYSVATYRINNGMLFEEAITIKKLSKNAIHTVDGVDKILNEWCCESGVAFQTMISRLYKGWTFKEAITPIENKPIIFSISGKKEDEETQTLEFWCELLVLEKDKTYLRILRGETLKDIAAE